jgi:anhydro-N-acetylmuramic acid kinase
MREVEQLRRKARKRVVGIMSGTSADGIGVVSAIVEGSGLDTRARIEAFRVFPYSAEVRERLLRLTTGEASATDVCLMNYVIGELYARSALALLAEAGIDPAQVDLVGMDGHTIQRVFPAVAVDGVQTGATLQIGEPAVVAERTGLTTVSHFRTRDVAVGGEGAPISSYVDYLLFRDPRRTRAVLNIGGISAMTIAPAGAGVDRVFAVTAGPGNMVIDAVVRRLTDGRLQYDADGAWARRGRVHRGLLHECMRHPFFDRTPPKSAGRELFGAAYVDDLMRRRVELGIGDDDLVATVTALTAESIADQIDRFVRPIAPLDDIVAGGGGVHNAALIDMLRSRVGSVLPLSDFGIDVDAKEPLMFAIFANETLHGIRGNVPAATGASCPVVLGTVTPGRSTPPPSATGSGRSRGRRSSSPAR